jgi:hypothetical protein
MRESNGSGGNKTGENHPDHSDDDGAGKQPGVG